MKIWNFIKFLVLLGELNLRRIAYFTGIGSIILWGLTFYAMSNSYEKIVTKTDDSFKNHLFEITSISSFFSTVILISIFILVATRKFKELNQLIKEKETLLDNE